MGMRTDAVTADINSDTEINMPHWRITLLDAPVWNGRQFIYCGVPSVGNTVEFGDSPVRDRLSRIEFIAELVAAGAKFTVEYKA